MIRYPHTEGDGRERSRSIACANAAPINTEGTNCTMTDTILGTFHLHDEIARLTPGDSRSGRRAETLIKTDLLRVILVTMRAGAELQEHTAPGPITIQALLGRFSVSVGDDEHDLAHGDLISIQTAVPHAVRAVEDGAFLLTISWLPDDAADSAAVDLG